MKKCMWVIGVLLCMASGWALATPSIGVQLMSLERWKTRLTAIQQEIEETSVKKESRQELQREISQYLEDIRDIKALIEKVIRNGDQVQLNQIQVKIETLSQLVTTLLEKKSRILPQ